MGEGIEIYCQHWENIVFSAVLCVYVFVREYLIVCINNISL